jgi:hypothetical protein
LTPEIFQVPVIALFTKFEQFKLDIKMKLEDEHDYPETRIDAEIGRVFKEHYLGSLTGTPPFICLESKDFVTDESILY